MKILYQKVFGLNLSPIDFNKKVSMAELFLVFYPIQLENQLSELSYAECMTLDSNL